jgi:hypothetical protein
VLKKYAISGKPALSVAKEGYGTAKFAKSPSTVVTVHAEPLALATFRAPEPESTNATMGSPDAVKPRQGPVTEPTEAISSIDH